MPKVFYTEIDIEDLVKRGILSLEVNDNVVLTDLAYEKANRLGLKLVRERPENPPAAPVRPYLSQAPARGQVAPGQAGPVSSSSRPSAPAPERAASAPPAREGDLHERIRSAVVARMGNQVDPTLLDAIIKRVIASTGVK